MFTSSERSDLCLFLDPEAPGAFNRRPSIRHPGGSKPRALNASGASGELVPLFFKEIREVKGQSTCLVFPLKGRTLVGNKAFGLVSGKSEL